jgi:hypothetical protein
MNKLYIDHVEFYITNVCNLTCNNCRSFNNYKFSGSYQFDRTNTMAWAKKMYIEDIAIQGGEPTLHPNLEEWISGLREAWPTSKMKLFTNGTRMSKSQNLHNILAKYNCDLQISVHSIGLRSLIADEILSTFGECEISTIVKTQPYGVVNNVWLKTKKGVVIDLQNGGTFQDICFVDANFNLRKSDPIKAHDSCAIKYCHPMIDGKLYKCSITGVLPEFLKQQNKNTDHLLPTNGIDVESVTQEQLDNLKNPMDFCTVCPESNKYVPTTSILKKDLKFSKDNI